MVLFLPVLLSFCAADGIAAPVPEVVEMPELAGPFLDQGVVGTFVMLDVTNKRLYAHNVERASERFLPASTFKIANSLIGLDCGAVADVDEIFPYDGTPRYMKSWERDMGLRDAIRVSCVPVYQELARGIGLERMADGVKHLNYGNMEIGQKVDVFWLEGPLKISALEQVEFLRRLASGELPAKPEAMREVREITIVETTPQYTLHAKTGWTARVSPDIGWWVGWIDRGSNTYVFALNIDMPAGNKDASKREAIARSCLKLLGAL